MKGSSLNVWLYIGGLLAIYGVLLIGGGIVQWIHPPGTVLEQYHATFWAGIVLLFVGGLYVALQGPFRRR